MTDSDTINMNYDSCDRSKERRSTHITLPSFHFCPEPRSRVLCLSEDRVAMLALLFVVTMGADYYYYLDPGKNGPEIGEIIRQSVTRARQNTGPGTPDMLRVESDNGKTSDNSDPVSTASSSSTSC